MMRFLGILGAVLLAAAVPAAEPVPAAEEDRAVFDQVDSRLDRNGDLYALYSVEHFKALVSNWLDLVAEDYLDEDDAEKFNQLCDALGLNAIVALGFSSAPVAGADSVYNFRQFLYTGDNPVNGLFWDLMGENRDTAGIIAGWPSNTIYAFAFNPDFRALGERLMEVFPELEYKREFDMLVTLTEAVSGPMEFLVIDRGDDLAAMRLIITDHDNTVFNMIREQLFGTQGIVVTEDTIRFPVPPQLPLDALELTKGENTLTFTTLTGMDKLIADSIAADGGLAAAPAYRALAAGMPDEVMALAYTSSDFLDRFMAATTSLQGMLMPFELPEMPRAGWDQSILSWATVLEDGILGVTASRIPLMEYQVRQMFLQLRNSMLQQREIMGLYQNMWSIEEDAGEELSSEAAWSNALRQLHLAVLVYADEHEGALPAGTPDGLAAAADEFIGVFPWDNLIYLGDGMSLESDDYGMRYPLMALLPDDGGEAMVLRLDGHIIRMDMTDVPATAVDFVKAYLNQYQLGEVETSTLEHNAREWDAAAKE